MTSSEGDESDSESTNSDPPKKVYYDKNNKPIKVKVRKPPTQRDVLSTHIQKI